MRERAKAHIFPLRRRRRFPNRLTRDWEAAWAVVHSTPWAAETNLHRLTYSPRRLLTHQVWTFLVLRVRGSRAGMGMVADKSIGQSGERSSNNERLGRFAVLRFSRSRVASLQSVRRRSSSG